MRSDVSVDVERPGSFSLPVRVGAAAGVECALPFPTVLDSIDGSEWVAGEVDETGCDGAAVAALGEVCADAVALVVASTGLWTGFAGLDFGSADVVTDVAVVVVVGVAEFVVAVGVAVELAIVLGVDVAVAAAGYCPGILASTVGAGTLAKAAAGTVAVAGAAAGLGAGASAWTAAAIVSSVLWAAVPTA